MEPLLEHYSAAAALHSLDAQAKAQLSVLEGQLAWMVSIVGSVIKGRLSSSSGSAEGQEAIDGDLSARVFGLLPVMDAGVHAQRYGENSRQRLDMALLAFFQNFRKVYIGEQVRGVGGDLGVERCLACCACRQRVRRHACCCHCNEERVARHACIARAVRACMLHAGAAEHTHAHCRAVSHTCTRALHCTARR